MLMNMSGEDVFNANILHRLGRFSEGLSVKDIEALPFDTEMLSIIEVMSNFEDDLSSAQVINFEKFCAKHKYILNWRAP